MKIKLLIMVMSVFLLNTAANAAMITFTNSGGLVHYSISGGSGNIWSGDFTVSSWAVAANDASGNTTRISATAFSDIGSISNFINPSPTTLRWGDVAGNYFTIDSSFLYTAIVTGSETWNSLLSGGNLGGGSYTISGAIYHSGGSELTTYATPEPGTMLLLGSGILTFGLSRFRRRKQVASFA